MIDQCYWLGDPRTGWSQHFVVERPISAVVQVPAKFVVVEPKIFVVEVPK